MSKKILSLALAVIMLFSVCAVAVNAGVNPDVPAGKIGIRLETNAKVGTPAGSSVWVKFYYDAPVSSDVLLQFQNITIAWSTAAYSPAKSTTAKLNSDITFSSTYGSFVNTDANFLTTTGKKALKAADKTKYGWDNAVQISIGDKGADVNTGTGIPIADYDCEVFTMNFKTNKTLEATDIIGFPTAGYAAGTQFNVATFDLETYSTTPVALENLVVTNAVPEASYDVYNLGGKNGEDAVKKANDDGTYKIGTFFAFKAATIDPEFNAIYRSENIDGITATITATKADGTTSTITADPIDYVYDVSAAKDKSELGFVVVINGIPNDDTSITSYTITPVMQTNDGKTYTCETLTVNVADLA